MSRAPCILAILLAALPLVQADAPKPPLLVAAADLDDANALVAWTPGPAPVEAYRVYGVAGPGALAFLGEVPAADALAVVPAGYGNYAVSAVVDGAEGAPTYGARSACVSYRDNPPDLSVGPSCVFDLIEKARGILRA